MNILLRRLYADGFKQLNKVEIQFPDSGSVLIEGYNEAGKSSLFEAIFFALYGRPLSSGDKLEELKGYDAEQMRVELDFTVDGRPFTVERRLAGNHRAKLRCPGSDGREESEITILGAVKARLEAEIRLSATALLNTCFVEQKNLERLETGATKAERQATINELLNLDSLNRLIEQFKLTREDREALETLRRRLEVARLDARIPEAERMQSEARRCLLFARLIDAERRIQELENAIEQARQQREVPRERREEIAKALAACNRLRARITAVEGDLTHRASDWRRAIELHAEVARRVQELEELEAGLPARRAHLEAITTLADRLNALIALEAELAAAEKQHDEILQIQDSIRQAEERVSRTGAQVREYEEAAGNAEGTLNAARIRTALLEWAEACERLDESAGGERLPEVLKRQEETAKRAEACAVRIGQAAGRFTRGLIMAGAGVLAGAVGFLAGFPIPAAIGGVVVLLIGLALALRARREESVARDEERQARSESDSLAGERRALEESARSLAGQRSAWEERETAARRTLKELNEPVPASAIEARNRAARSPQVALPEAEREWHGTQANLLRARAQHEAASNALETERRRLTGRDEAALNERMEELRRRIESESEVLSRLEEKGLPLDPSELQTQRALYRRSLEEGENTVLGLPDARREQEAASTAIEATRAELEARWMEAIPEEPLPETPALAQDRLNQIAAAARADIYAHDEPRLQAEDADLARTLDQLDQAILLNTHQQAECRQEAGRIRQDLGAAEDDPAESLVARFPELAEASRRSVAEWNLEVERQTRESDRLRVRRSELALPLNLDETPLDPADAEEAVAEEERRQAVKRRAGEIVAKARKTILDRVMPLTEQNVARILPLLTEGRYHDVKWDDDSGTLTVYDARARRHVRKGVFSGGARDQISLALRLAFALATLPGEHAIRPGWLILDEPLSSFDRVRTQALVDLMTGQGLLKRQFPQVFLISHSASFDPACFDHRLHLESGRIVETTLPCADLTHAVAPARQERAVPV